MKARCANRMIAAGSLTSAQVVFDQQSYSLFVSCHYPKFAAFLLQKGVF